MWCTCFDFGTLLLAFQMKWGTGACYDVGMVLKSLAEMRTVGTLLLLVFASIVAVCLETGTPARNVPAHETGIVPQFAIQDFDGDSKPDIATVLEGRRGSVDIHYRIRFQLSSGRSQNIDLTAPVGGLDISSRDVNGDDFTDVIVTTARTNQPVAVLLNDGAGNFTASEPSAFPGAFRNSQHFWIGLAEELREASPASLSRYFSSDLDAGNATSSLPVETRVFTVRPDHLETRDAAVSYLGRAPPILKARL